jgi:hypothetical protein
MFQTPAAIRRARRQLRAQVKQIYNKNVHTVLKYAQLLVCVAYQKSSASRPTNSKKHLPGRNGKKF